MKLMKYGLPLTILIFIVGCTTTKRGISSTESNACSVEQVKRVQQSCAYLVPESSCERELKIVESSLEMPPQEVRRYNFSYLESQPSNYIAKYIFFFTALTGSQMMNNTREDVLPAAHLDYIKATVKCGLEMTDLSKRRE